jgi:hypothetical protein
MNKLLFVFFFILFHLLSNAQNPYIEYNDVRPVLKSFDDITEISALCQDCPNSHPDAGTGKHNQIVRSWYARFEKIRNEQCKYDSMHHYYLATDSFLRLVRSEYYQMIVGNLTKYIFIGPNQNSSSPEYIFNQEDEAVLTARYRLICKDCPYSKKKPLYYIFYYNAKGNIVKHGLAYMDEKRKRK